MQSINLEIHCVSQHQLIPRHLQIKKFNKMPFQIHMSIIFPLLPLPTPPPHLHQKKSNYRHQPFNGIKCMQFKYHYMDLCIYYDRLPQSYRPRQRQFQNQEDRPHLLPPPIPLPPLLPPPLHPPHSYYTTVPFKPSHRQISLFLNDP